MFTNVTDMNSIFSYSKFNNDISNWNVSNVTNMSRMFYNVPGFNSDLSNWDVSNVTNMSQMFEVAVSFNSDISNWNISKFSKIWGVCFTNSNGFSNLINA